ncbi:hypothetical protein ElyMa_000007700 [Elysia marginata]|uniref:MRG domain-containing protein n=1 Tax=Elysia marginata TaxID=1093978 RepID=A0AAV4EAF9_9GAST|nr:hypothetical protein ElyMa_000007700 [Elysia marginata]
MASNENSSEHKNLLKESDIKQIVALPAENAKELLSTKLGLGPYLDPKDLQKAPFITFLYDNIAFTLEKGFPLMHISLVVKFAHEYLKRILVKDHRLADAIKDFKEKSEIISPLSDRHKKQYTDFIHQTILCHYSLYKYVFSHLRDIVCPKITKDVEVPPCILPLQQGRDIVEWEYQNKVSEVEKKEKEAAKGNQERLEKLKEDKSTTHKTLEDLNNEPTPYSKMTLNELVNDILKGYTEKKEAEFSVSADATAESLIYKFEKTAIARPAVLGPPKRFKPRSPVGSRLPNINNSSSNLKAQKEKSPRSARSKSGRGSSTSAASKK